MKAENSFRHFLDLCDIESKELRNILESAKKMKAEVKKGIQKKLLDGVQLALIFEKPSTRTRVSFEAAMSQLGGHSIIMSHQDTQLARGETIADTTRVLSRYVDILMLRTYRHETLLEMAEHATVPVINGLTDSTHPCQLLADIMTIEERLGNIKGKTVAWVGDSNNMAYTWIQAAEKFQFNLNVACPEELLPRTKQPDAVRLMSDPKEAVKGVHCITTDTWQSMGDAEAEYKVGLLKPDYQVNDELFALADKHAIFLHCLPAHRGHEVTDSVMDGPQSAVWDEAENRMHVQKAILLWCLGKL